jgi:hypothetical protein
MVRVQCYSHKMWIGVFSQIVLNSIVSTMLIYTLCIAMYEAFNGGISVPGTVHSSYIVLVV